MTTIFFIFLGLFVGGVLADEQGVVVGLFIGLVFGMITTLKGRIFRLEQQLAQAMKLFHNIEASKVDATEASSLEPEQVVENTNFSKQHSSVIQTIIQPPTDDAQAPLIPHAEMTTNEPTGNGGSVTREQENQSITHKPDFALKVFFAIRDFFTTGNIVVKVGAIILFFGVAFLLKYAADKNVFPIELRLMTVIAIGIVMLIIGRRLRTNKLEYGLVLQGAGLGLLYLTVFSASKFYDVLPINLSFVLMLMLVALTGLLAVKQNAKSLALFGITGGFLAPILMSTDSGSHITLFSYYALLNVGIFTVAWFKSWRVLNLIGFFFTFIISAAWGYKAYQPEYFVSTELFLILFYTFYLIIPILFAFKQAPKMKGYVDGTLVFGLPLIAFALQSGLVDQFEYGQAITAVIMAVIYLWLAKKLWFPKKEGFRLLAESYLALGVTFLSLAVPLALDSRWTAAVWSLEGAGLVWVGLRQSRFMPRLLGVILSVGAGLAFIESTYRYLSESIPILNSAYMGMVLVSLSAFFISYLYFKYQQRTYILESKLTIMIIIWGLIWWFYAGISEINRFVPELYILKASALFIALSTFAQIAVGYKFNWSKISLTACLFMPAIALILLVEFIFYNHQNPMAYLGYIAWPMAFFVHLLILRRKQGIWSKWILTIYHATSVLFIALIATWSVENWVNSIPVLSSTWTRSTTGIMLALIAWSIMRWGHRLKWPVQHFSYAYYLLGLLPVMLTLVFWQLSVARESGIPSPLHYIPILNPLDLAQGIAITVLIYWLWFMNTLNENKGLSIPSIFISSITAAMSFLWINIVIARSVHVFNQVHYSGYAMMHSSVFQASASITWSVIAMLLMLVAYKQSSRQFWFAGAGLLALVVTKLFFVDLADSDSISRIVSFLVVGGLMLVIGYLSPLPPKVSTK